jgi:TonB-linked SusC/RagA family outer membrane protein
MWTGNFLLPLPPVNSLEISYIGYIAKEVPIGDNTQFTITLMEDSKALDEVIVIGYGTAKRQDYTGSVGSVKLENSALSNLPNLNILESLKGTVTGMNIGATNSAGGEPGMLIRGQNSISGNNNPLIVLDGVIYMGSLSDINPNDIANIDVLKDAVSAAAYGSRAGNGIIAITTKKGRSEKPVVSLNISTGVNTWAQRPTMLNGAGYLELVNARNGYPEGSTYWLKTGEMENYNAGKERVWLDEVTQTGVVQDYQLSVSGAGKGINYYLSTSFNDDKGVVVGDDFNRISIFGKVNTDITNWLNIGVDANYSRRDYPGVRASLYAAQRLSPYSVMYRDDEGNLEKYPWTQSAVNPLWDTKSGTRDKMDVRQSLRMNAYAVIRIPWIDGLSFRMNFLPNIDFRDQGSFYHEGYYIQEGEGLERYSPASLQKLLTRANGTLLNSKAYSYVFDNILTYKKEFGKHSVEATLVATRDHFNYDIEYLTGSDFADNGNTTLGMWGLHKATVQKIDLFVNNNEIGGTLRTNIDYLSRISYGYDNKYYFTGSLRKDGASVFGSKNKWAKTFFGVL